MKRPGKKVPLIVFVLVILVLQKDFLDSITPVITQKAVRVTTSSEETPGLNKQDGGRLCGNLLECHLPLSNAWSAWEPVILNASFVNNTAIFNDIRSHPNASQWLHDSQKYFNYQRLHSTIGKQSADLEAYSRIRQILERRLAMRDNTADAPPLEILVLGGSVTSGHQCLNNHLGFKMRKDRKSDMVNSAIKECAWPARLQSMLDALWGPGVVRITNMAQGGTESNTGGLIIDFGLWPKGYPPQGPDLVIWDYGANDSRSSAISNDKDMEEEIIQHFLEPFYQSTRSLQCHNEHGPIALFVDSYIGFNEPGYGVQKMIKMTDALQKFHSWYPGTVGVSYTSMLRPYLYGNLNKENEPVPLLGSGLIIHPGMMYHISVAWTVLFNLVHSLRDSCWNNNSNTTALFPPSLGKSIDVIDVPMRDPSFGLEGLQEYQKLWLDRNVERNKRCNISVSSTTPGKEQQQAPRCMYAWMHNHVTGVITKSDVQKQLEPYLIHNATIGWKADGFPVRQPRAGWFANSKGAVFEMEFQIQQNVRYLIVQRMLSYSKQWADANVRIDCVIHKKEKNETEIRKTQFDMSGYHQTQTSILVPISFELPIGLLPGDKLNLKFTLVTGETFKISGMALCS